MLGGRVWAKRVIKIRGRESTHRISLRAGDPQIAATLRNRAETILSGESAPDEDHTSRLKALILEEQRGRQAAAAMVARLECDERAKSRDPVLGSGDPGVWPIAGDVVQIIRPSSLGRPTTGTLVAVCKQSGLATVRECSSGEEASYPLYSGRRTSGWCRLPSEGDPGQRPEVPRVGDRIAVAHRLELATGTAQTICPDGMVRVGLDASPLWPPFVMAKGYYGFKGRWWLWLDQAEGALRRQAGEQAEATCERDTERRVTTRELLAAMGRRRMMREVIRRRG